MPTEKDITKKQAEIVGQLQQFPIGRSKSGGRAGGTIEVVATNPLPGQPKVVRAKCANDCPPGDVQLIKADDGSYVALSPNAAVKTSETTTRQILKKNPTMPKKDPEIWPCTVAFLYSRIKPYTERLTDNGAAVGDETSWDGQAGIFSTKDSLSKYGYVFRQRFDTLGDYATAQDALDNKLKPDRLIVPPGGSESAASRDKAVIGSGSADDVIVWFYIGAMGERGTTLGNDGQIFNISGRSTYPGNVVEESGPGFCMEMYRAGLVSLALYPIADMGGDPLTRYLSSQFPEVGGKIGYWGNIYKWRGMQDYTTGMNRQTFYFREYWNISHIPLYPGETVLTPTSYPPDYTDGITPWTLENNAWYRYGWDIAPSQIQVMSGGLISVVTSAIASGTCGLTVPNDQWYWPSSGLSAGSLDARLNDSPAKGMFVCWRGHKDNAAKAEEFFNAFRNYWDIPGTVTRLRSCNPYGCQVSDGGGGVGGGYPPAPPVSVSRFLGEAYGRKAEIWLKICKEDMPPVELKLPFEFAALIEQVRILGGGSFYTDGSSATFEANKVRNKLMSYGQLANVYTGPQDTTCEVENPHGTLSIDKEFAYIDILYGAERVWETPLLLPIAPKLGRMGFGSSSLNSYGTSYLTERFPSICPDYKNKTGHIRRSGDVNVPTSPDTHPRVVEDCFIACQSYKVRLPTKENPIPVIVDSQKYKKGEDITLTKANPDNEFNNKFLIADFRSDNRKLEAVDQVNFEVIPQPYCASFAGLPALMQIVGDYNDETIGSFTPDKFYKNKSDWTPMDYLHFELQEAPRQYSVLTTILPPNVYTRLRTNTGVIFDLDGKFDRQGRAEGIIPATPFGYQGETYSPTYHTFGPLDGFYPLAISFKEQLIGNGLLKDNKLFKWFRVSTASFPILGQLTRNP